MVRDHIAQCAGLFVEGSTVFDTHGFGRGDLYIVDVVSVPHRFEERVAEAEDEDVLDCFFAEIVIDPIDRLLFEYTLHHSIEYVRRIQVPTKGFFEDNSRPSMIAAVQPSRSQTFNDGPSYRGRRRHVE